MSNEIIIGQGAQATAYCCPKCSSYSIVKSGAYIVEAKTHPVHCDACGWAGDQSQLIGSFFQHGFSNDESILKTMLNDLRLLLAKEVAAHYARFLQKWGFLEEPVTVKQLGQYLETIAGSTLAAIIELRKATHERAARERAGL